GRRRIALDDGRELGYDALLLATGSRVRRLTVPGAGLAGIHYLRTIADADGVSELMSPGRRLAIVGAGYIGLEVAAVARSRGLDVTVLEAADRVMARVVCAEVSQIYARAHESHGVRIVCGAGVREFVGDGQVSAVITADGRSHPCDFVVAGIGIIPETGLAESAGIACDDGICVDEHARTSKAGIYAAGDCTNHPSPLVGRRVRLESVQNAIEQAKTAAASIAGEDACYEQVPWFWSDQYDLKLQIAGLSQGYDRIVLRGSPAERRFAVYYLRAGQLIAVDAVNSPKDFLLGKRLLAARATPDSSLLEDARVDVDALGAASLP
ncbi:MAG TPA: FAD-dependent oxidoreductase, partial [Gammaproteobacteria bacterium]|nr:FAD-dependent oxidoreductase [Gammaproteobacteria bacterium]